MLPENIQTVNRMDAELRHFDPLQTVEPGYDDAKLAEIAQNDLGRIEDILATDKSLTAKERQELYLMGCNLHLEWLYADNGGAGAELTEFNQHLSVANDFMTRAGKDAQAHRERDGDPRPLWSVAVKHNDLLALQAYRNAQDSQATLRGTQAGSEAWALAENQMGRVLHRSVGLIKDMQQYASGRTELAQDARGLLFESLLLTYSRLKTYENQEIDTVFTRSALDREDRPWNGHAYPKRSFDIVVESPDETELWQSKNYRNTDEYARPIKKMMSGGFGQVMDRLDSYVAGLDLLVKNPSDPHYKEAMDRAAKRLDGLFDSMLVEA